MSVRRRLVKRNTEAALHVFRERFGLHRLARLGLADLDHVCAGRMTAKVVIERDDAVNVGARKIQRRCDDRDRCIRNVMQPVLNRVQDLEQWARLRLILGECKIDLLARVRVERLRMCGGRIHNKGG